MSKNMIVRVVLGGLAAGAAQVISIPGIPAWLNAVLTVLLAVLGMLSPSVVGVKKPDELPKA